MSREPTRLAVLGYPLSFTRSPELHRAGMRALGIEGASDARPTRPDDLAARLRELAERGCLGVNLTHPLKERVIESLARVSDPARQARSVNTVGFAPDGWWGDTTDGPGFVDWLQSMGREPARERMVLLGAGGAARSIAYALLVSGAAEVAVSARRPDDARASWMGIPGPRLLAWGGEAERQALERATLVVRATPPDADTPDLTVCPGRALIVDLTYGASLGAWVQAARAQGREAYDGLGLLVFQARRSLALWFGRPVPVDPLAAAVGWPR